MGYEVKCVDGPAAGFGYVTFVAPEPAIEVAPLPSAKREEWFRVATPSPEPWPGQAAYRMTGGDAGHNEEGDVVIEYRLEAER